MARWAKRCLPHSWRQAIKRACGLEIAPEKVEVRARLDPDASRPVVAIRAGGGLGDFIVYLAVVDQLLQKYGCEIHIFTFSHGNAQRILGSRDRVFIHSPLGLRANYFDVVLELDHYVHVCDYHARRLRRKSRELYDDVQRIIRWSHEHVPVTENLLAQRNVIMFRAKYLGLNRWTQLSCGGVFDMAAMRSDVGLDESRIGFLTEHGLESKRYITVCCGADRDMGGMRQTKLWPIERYEEFIEMLGRERPETVVVQLALGDEPRLKGAAVCVRDADLEDVKVVLANSAVNLSSEGGMAHLATQLGTQCVVLFGPTPVHYYGYPWNVNVVSAACSGCMECTDKWFINCSRGLDKAECMETISVGMVLDCL